MKILAEVYEDRIELYRATADYCDNKFLGEVYGKVNFGTWGDKWLLNSENGMLLVDLIQKGD